MSALFSDSRPTLHRRVQALADKLLLHQLHNPPLQGLLPRRHEAAGPAAVEH
jgi:hypothetical protein